MNNTVRRTLATLVLVGAALAVSSTAHADTGVDILNVVNAKRIPVSALSSGSTSADNIQVDSVEQIDDGSIDVDAP
ncbi:hypothetical protein AB0N93_16620 [Streptomyces sp. NPDC091267]|uniref:hypothetical protein n=1 Tax=unclassified Streptomyces TaxID=2593676 RepID=UPI00341E91FC